MENIFHVRHFIHERAAKKFKRKGGANFTRLSGYDVRILFNLYDKYIFNHQIFSQLEKQNSEIKFTVKARINGISGICGEKVASSEECIYYFDIAPLIIARLKKVGGLVCIDRLYCLQYIVERCIIHLLMLLWKYWNIKNDVIYSTHGPLFRCMLKTYFDQDFYSSERKLTSISESIYPYTTKTQLEKGLFVYWENSCYLDSLMMALLMGASNFYRKNILTINVDDFDYGGKKFTPFCPQATSIKKTKQIASKVQKQLLMDYERLSSGEYIYCSQLRKYLTKCLPSLKGRRGYVEYNVSEVYSLLTDLFPSLKIYSYPVLIRKAGQDPIQTIYYRPRALFQMWDFMSSSPEGETILWDDITTSTLVFQNGMAPAIKNFSDPSSEKITSWGPIPGKFKTIKRKGESVRIPVAGKIQTIIDKERIFGEYILDGRYRLFAVLIVHGPRPQSIADWGGGHYTAYIRPYFDKDNWYYYNDQGPTWKKEKALPSEVFIDKRWQRPELFFYLRGNR